MKINIDEKALEKSLQNVDTERSEPKISKEEEVGFHKGCLNTLVNERNELFKMIQNVEAIMQAHAQRLQELGVKLETGKK